MFLTHRCHRLSFYNEKLVFRVSCSLSKSHLLSVLSFSTDRVHVFSNHWIEVHGQWNVRVWNEAIHPPTKWLNECLCLLDSSYSVSPAGTATYQHLPCLLIPSILSSLSFLFTVLVVRLLFCVDLSLLDILSFVQLWMDGIRMQGE